jgi:hypothetical protein
MKRYWRNIPLCIGLVLFSGIQIAEHVMKNAMPETLYTVLLFLAVGLEILGIILMAKSPEIKNSRLRRWKMRLIGKEK